MSCTVATYIATSLVSLAALPANSLPQLAARAEFVSLVAHSALSNKAHDERDTSSPVQE